MIVGMCASGYLHYGGTELDKKRHERNKRFYQRAAKKEKSRHTWRQRWLTKLRGRRYHPRGRWIGLRDRSTKRLKYYRERFRFARRVLSRHGHLKGSTLSFAHQSTTPNHSGSIRPRMVVIHTTEGGYSGALAWLKNPVSRASAHLVISRTGGITQLVPFDKKAWHAVAANSYSIGIEHEGYVGQKYPNAQLVASARATAWICKRYNIPVKYVSHPTGWSKGITGHQNGGISWGGHNDPGHTWPWYKYIDKVQKYQEKL